MHEYQLLVFVVELINMEFLRDPIWQFVGAIIAVIGVVAAVWIYLLQKNKKSLSYNILASNELLTASEEIRGRIKILFDKKPVENVHLLVMQITNDGNLPILPSDFYEPIKISFGDGSKLLSAETTNHFPDSFQPELNIEGNSVSIIPTLINSKDTLVIKFLLAQYRNGLKIGARIAGINQITTGNTIPIWSRLFYWSGWSGFISLIVGAIIEQKGGQGSIFHTIFLTLASINLIIWFAIIFLRKAPKAFYEKR